MRGDSSSSNGRRASRSQLRTGQRSERKKWFPLENKPSAKKPPSPPVGAGAGAVYANHRRLR